MQYVVLPGWVLITGNNIELPCLSQDIMLHFLKLVLMIRLQKKEGGIKKLSLSVVCTMKLLLGFNCGHKCFRV